MYVVVSRLAGRGFFFFFPWVASRKFPSYPLLFFPLLPFFGARRGKGAAFKTRHSLFKKIAIVTACVWIAIAVVVPPMVARFFPAYQLFQQSCASLQPNMQFASVEFEEPSLVWYFRWRLKSFLTPLKKRRAAEFMSD